MEVSKARGQGENESESVGQCLLLELPLGKVAETFHLETVVCSHGFFMMAANRWDPVSKTLLRPLRLTLHSPYPSVMVRISKPPHRPQCLHLHVYASTTLSLFAEIEQALLCINSLTILSQETSEESLAAIAGMFSSKAKGIEWSLNNDASNNAVLVASEAHAVTLAVEGLLGVAFTVATLTDEAVDVGELESPRFDYDPPARCTGKLLFSASQWLIQCG